MENGLRLPIRPDRSVDPAQVGRISSNPMRPNAFFFLFKKGSFSPSFQFQGFLVVFFFVCFKRILQSKLQFQGLLEDLEGSCDYNVRNVPNSLKLCGSRGIIGAERGKFGRILTGFWQDFWELTEELTTGPDFAELELLIGDDVQRNVLFHQHLRQWPITPLLQQNTVNTTWR